MLLTTVHPYAVSTGLSHKPRTRFPLLVPILNAKDTAQAALDGARRGQHEVFVPGRLQFLLRMAKLLPVRVQMAISKFLDVGVGYK